MLGTRAFSGAAIALLLPLSLTANASPTEVFVRQFGIPSAWFQANYTISGGGFAPTQWGTSTYSEDGAVPGITVTLPDLSHGGIVPVGGVPLGEVNDSAEYVMSGAYINGPFSLTIGQPDPTGHWFGGSAAVTLSGQIQGSIAGPAGLVRPALETNLTGVASSAYLNGNAADLPSPLLDILDNPSHLHIIGTIGDPKRFDQLPYLELSLYFDPPSPVAVPEPTTLAVMVAGAAWLGVRRAHRPRQPR